MTELEELCWPRRPPGLKLSLAHAAILSGRCASRASRAPAHWNPNINDGDAFKLAIDLGMQVNVEGSGEDEAVWADDTMIWVNSEYAQGDRRKAARSAIVSVAAQRGEKMP